MSIAIITVLNRDGKQLDGGAFAVAGPMALRLVRDDLGGSRTTSRQAGSAL
jgi:hypothetical protein